MDDKIISMLLKRLIDKADDVDTDEIASKWDSEEDDYHHEPDGDEGPGPTEHGFYGGATSEPREGAVQKKDNCNTEDVGDDDDEELRLVKLFR